MDNGNVWPETVAVVLWGTDNIKTYGESLAQVIDRVLSMGSSFHCLLQPMNRLSWLSTCDWQQAFPLCQLADP